MNTLLRLLTFPVTGPVEGLLWLAEKITEQAEAQFYDEGAVRSRLLELEAKLDMGEITEEEYDAAEDVLLQRLREIRLRREEAQGS